MLCYFNEVIFQLQQVSYVVCYFYHVISTHQASKGPSHIHLKNVIFIEFTFERLNIVPII
jgi:hypothetical protein